MRTEEQSRPQRHPRAGSERVPRRDLLKMGFLAGLGLATGASFRALEALPQETAPGSGGSAGPDPGAPSDPLMGELGQAHFRSYRGKTSSYRNPGRDGTERRAIPSSCLQCVAICGIIGYVEDRKIVKIEGNPYCPNNRGMICAKGQAGVNQVYDPDRLHYPLVRVGGRGEGRWRRLPMDEALDLAVNGGEIAGSKVEGLKAVYESDKPEEFMFHYGRSRIKPAVTHFVKTGFGSATIGNHTAICETAKWLGNELTMGKHYDINDVAHSRYILIFGANVLEAHTSHSYFAQRIIEGKMAGAKIVTFDVRLSNTAARSDEWIPILPGTDLAVILGMTNVVLNEQPQGKPLYDETFINKWTNVTLEQLRRHYARYTPEWAEGESGVPAETIRRIALEYSTRKPSSIVTYRGFVGHYNGAYAEWAAKTLDAISGNFNVKGGIFLKVAGKSKDAYADKVAKEHKDAVRKTKKLNILDGENLHLPTHHANEWIYEMIADGRFGRPKIYMVYVYNGAYVPGDCRRNLEILKNEEYIPFIISVDVAMSETTECADLILPDATYLERWTLEATQSYALVPFLQLRKPLAPPMGEAMDMQDIFIQLARRIGGPIAKLFPFDSAEEHIKASIDLQVADNAKRGKTFYTVDGEPLQENAWEYLNKFGILLQATKPTYLVHEKQLKPEDLQGKVIDEETGVIWDPKKAHVSEEDVQKKGYRGSKKAYKGYVGQMIDGVAYKGFKPDKFNKSGLFEIHSGFMTGAAEKVLPDIKDALRPEEQAWVAEHLASGMPAWVPVPEHRHRQPNQLIMTSFKVNVQIHSRSQNCKWLQEIWHINPAWIHPATARRLLGPGVKEGDMVQVLIDTVALPWREGESLTSAPGITARLHLTQSVHPEVIAISYHSGHWAYGRYASGKPLDKSLSGAQEDGECIWWQQGLTPPADATRWSELAGVHPNWIIPNTPARVSGQWRSNDTVVSIALQR